MGSLQDRFANHARLHSFNSVLAVRPLIWLPHIGCGEQLIVSATCPSSRGFEACRSMQGMGHFDCASTGVKPLLAPVLLKWACFVEVFVSRPVCSNQVNLGMFYSKDAVKPSRHFEQVEKCPRTLPLVNMVVQRPYQTQSTRSLNSLYSNITQ